jgi:hypothetical protein
MSLPARLAIPAPRRPADDCPAAGPAVRPALPAGALSALIQARTCLNDAEQAARPVERYVAAYLAALRAATAIVVVRSPQRGSARLVSVWRLLGEVAPELADWAAFFAARSERRAAAEAGVPGVSDTDADEMLWRAVEFLGIVNRCLSGAAR